MRFSYIGGPRQRPDLNQPAKEAWKNFVDDGLRAEKLGFDSFFIGEHHFCFASGNSSPYVMLAEVAARTERIRVGTSITCLPFHNPLRVAEDIAAVDIVSKGRFDFGFGVGSQYEEFLTFGIPYQDRFARTWEAVDVIERCFSGEEEFSHEGKYYNFPEVRWILPTYQEKVPFFWGGFGPQGVKRAAERGFNLVAPDVTGVFTKTIRANGGKPEDRYIGFAHHLSIGKTREAAFEAIAEPSLWVNNIYATRRELDGSYPPESARISMEAFKKGHAEGKPVGMFAPVAGTVEDVIEFFLPIVRCENGIINHIMLEFRPPGTKTADVERSMKLFAEEVMPVLKAEAKY